MAWAFVKRAGSTFVQDTVRGRAYFKAISPDGQLGKIHEQMTGVGTILF